MEILIIVLLLLVLSGPIAFIWCMVLSSRMTRLEAEKATLQQRLWKLQGQIPSQPAASSSHTDPQSAVRNPVANQAAALYGFQTQEKSIQTSFAAPKEETTPGTVPAEDRSLSEASDDVQKIWQSIPVPGKVDFVPDGPKPSFACNGPEQRLETEIRFETPNELKAIDENIKSDSIPAKNRDITGTNEGRTTDPELKTPDAEKPSAQRSEQKPLGDRAWEKAHSLPEPKDGSFSWQSLELLIGRKILGWIAVVGFILSATFFIRYAVQEGWIGAIPASIKILGIAAVGVVFLGVGKYFSNKNWRRFSTMLSSAGMIIVFQAGYASYAFYDLLSLQTAGVVMSLIVLGAFLLAWHYQSKLLGILSILGGLAVPLLLSSGTDQHPQFFTYLIILNLGAVMLIGLLGRAPIAWLAFFGTQAEFWLWYDQFYVYPDKLAAVLLFQAAFYTVYLFDTTIASLIPWGKMDWTRTSRLVRGLTIRNQLEESDGIQTHPIQPSWDDAVRAILSPIILFGTIWILLRHEPSSQTWLGLIAFVGAAWYALLAVLYGKQIRRLWSRETDQSFSAYWKAGPTAATVIAFGFVAIGIPLLFSAHWIALGWIVVCSGLWYFGHRQENKTFLVLSYLFAGLGLVRLLDDIFSEKTFLPNALPCPVLNIEAAPSLAASLLIIFVAVLTNRSLQAGNFNLWPKKDAQMLNMGFGLLGFAFLTSVLSVESVRYFNLRPDQFRPVDAWASLSLTILWGFLALLLFETGSRSRSLTLRGTAMSGFFVVIAKMLFYDFATRLRFEEPIFNPFCPGLVLISLLLIGVCCRSRILGNITSKERNGWGLVGLVGIFSLIGILSIECYHYVYKNMESIPLLAGMLGDADLGRRMLAFNSLSLLWTGYALLLLSIGLIWKNGSVRICGGVILLCSFFKIGACELLQRPDYAYPVVNPYFLSILCPSIAAMLSAVYLTYFKKLENRQETDFFKALGVIGVLFVWTILSVECFAYFDKNPLSVISEPETGRFVAVASLTVLWTLLAGTFFVFGISCRSVVLRCLGVCVCFVLVGKIVALELFARPAFEMPLMNPYFLPIAIASAGMIVFAVWTTRFHPLEDNREKTAFLTLGLIGIILLWASASIECFKYFDIRSDWPDHQFLASASLTVFWTVLGVLLAWIGMSAKSRGLRILGAGMLALTFLKTLPWDLFARPAYMTPIWNPYAVPLIVLAFALIFVGLGLLANLQSDDKIERQAYRTLALIGVIFLWSVLSLECFRSVRLLQGAESEAWKAQMALSILWSVFAGILIFIGFVWRSPILRWIAILLFAVTLTKVLIVDMAGVHELYRFGAIFVLASVLTLAAWAYQRYKPEKLGQDRS